MKRTQSLWKRYAYVILIFLIMGGFIRREVALGAVLCMAAPIVLAGLGMKRYWCANFCPRGSLFDGVFVKYCTRKPIPMMFKQKVTRIFMVILVFGVFGWGIWRAPQGLEGLGTVFHRMIILTTFIGIILALYFNPRTWCSICPMGSIAAFVTYLKGKGKH